jgi:hypothetical protein
MVHAVPVVISLVMTSGDCTSPLRDLASRSKRTPSTLPRHNPAKAEMRLPALAGTLTVLPGDVTYVRFTYVDFYVHYERHA